jgi:uncharacterized protein
VIADLHLGLGAGHDVPGGPPGGSAARLADALAAAAERARAGRVLVAGDAKHPIVGVPRALRPVVFGFFADLLERGLEVELVPGNHDIGLVPHLPREVQVDPASGVVLEGVGVFHGHRWPSEEVLRAPKLVAGHLHPGFRFAPTAEDAVGKQRCWVRVKVPAGAAAVRPRSGRGSGRWREMVVLPAFNPLAGIEALNREKPARGRSFLYRRFLAQGEARAYLLDGTDLGPIPRPTAADPTPRSGRRAPSGR